MEQVACGKSGAYFSFDFGGAGRSLAAGDAMVGSTLSAEDVGDIDQHVGDTTGGSTH